MKPDSPAVIGSDETLQLLKARIQACTLCEAQLEHGPRPVVQVSAQAQLLIIGQAPGRRVHDSGIPFNDPSGDRLRHWLGVDKSIFYDPDKVAIMPMGFCYPGKGKSGDLPPRKECAAQWHQPLLARMPNVQLTLLIGQYAQAHYLDDHFKNLTERVAAWQQTAREQEGRIALPHPSPRNRRWFAQNPWFDETLLPYLQDRVKSLWDTP